MQDFVMKTPVLLIVFNRPHKAVQVFNKIRQVRPPKLFIVADGSRPNRPDEEELVRQCRAIKDLVDWDCDVKVNFAETNMGCKDRIASGITWAFEHVDELIILEDDCVPHVTFFRFCQELLEKYRNDTRIFSICGYVDNEFETFNESYAFSNLFGCWGWATWKRAWNYFDITMSQWPILKQDKYFKNVLSEKDIVPFRNEFNLTYEGKINSWGYRFFVNCLANHALQIFPRVNLVRNIGFESSRSRMQIPSICHLFIDEEMDFPLIHPNIISPMGQLPTEFNRPEEEIERMLLIFDHNFRKLLALKRYNDIITFFKDKVLKDRSFHYIHPLTLYHLSFVYHVAIAYFRLGDYEHAEAMIDIILAADPQNVDILLFMVQVQLAQRNFDKVYSSLEDLNQIDAASFTENQKILLAKILEVVNSIANN